MLKLMKILSLGGAPLTRLFHKSKLYLYFIFVFQVLSLRFGAILIDTEWLPFVECVIHKHQLWVKVT